MVQSTFDRPTKMNAPASLRTRTGAAVLIFLIGIPAVSQSDTPGNESSTGEVQGAAAVESPEEATAELPQVELLEQVPIEADLSTRTPQTEDGAYFHHYRMNVPAGSAWRVSAISQEFDPMLIVANDSGHIVSANDDRVIGETTDAQARGYASEGSSYRVTVRGLTAGDLGRYQLTASFDSPEVLDPMSSEIPVQDQSIERPDNQSLTIRGALTADDLTLPDASHYDPYFVRLTAGQNVQISLRSETFDGYLVLLAEDGRPVADADDGPSGVTDPTLVVPPVDAGVYQLLVSSFYADEIGAYELELQILNP